jgi:hypothetical protein
MFSDASVKPGNRRASRVVSPAQTHDPTFVDAHAAVYPVDTRTLAAYLGHRQIANTARYTKMDARRFDGFWPD